MLTLLFVAVIVADAQFVQTEFLNQFQFATFAREPDHYRAESIDQSMGQHMLLLNMTSEQELAPRLDLEADTVASRQCGKFAPECLLTTIPSTSVLGGFSNLTIGQRVRLRVHLPVIVHELDTGRRFTVIDDTATTTFVTQLANSASSTRAAWCVLATLLAVNAWA